MAKKINKLNQTPESGDSNQKKIKQEVGAIILTTIVGDKEDVPNKDVVSFFKEHKKLGSYEETKRIMPGFIDYIENNSLWNKNIAGAHVDQKNKIACIAKKDSQINGSGPMTYRVELTVRHDNQTKVFKLVTIDPPRISGRDEDYSRYNITFDSVKSSEDATSETFIITMHNNDKSKKRNYTAKFEKKEDKRPLLGLNEQQAFKTFFEKKSKEICVSETRENGFMKSPGTSQTIPWEKAKVRDQVMDIKHGVGALLIQTQIDCGANASSHNKQFGFRGYIIKHDGSVNNVWYECAREEQLGWIDFSIADKNKIDKEKVKIIADTTAQVLLEKYG